MWPNEWPLTISRSLWPCWISLDKCHTWDISSMWPNHCDLYFTRFCLIGLGDIIHSYDQHGSSLSSLLVWPIFHGSVILPYILNSICRINITPGILVPCDPMNDHLLYLGHCDSGILVPCDPIIDVKIYLCWCDLYFMVQWFCLVSWSWNLWPDYWRQNISLLLWPIFHGSVILPYILNTICWINVTPGILVQCDPMNDHLLYLGHCDLYFMYIYR